MENNKKQQQAIYYIDLAYNNCSGMENQNLISHFFVICHIWEIIQVCGKSDFTQNISKSFKLEYSFTRTL